MSNEEIPIERIENPSNDEDAKEVSWEQADILSSRFIKFETDTEKVMVLSNWNLVQKKDRFDESAPPKIFFVATITEEDGEPVDKVLEYAKYEIANEVKTNP